MGVGGTRNLGDIFFFECEVHVSKAWPPYTLAPRNVLQGFLCALPVLFLNLTNFLEIDPGALWSLKVNEARAHDTN